MCIVRSGSSKYFLRDSKNVVQAKGTSELRAMANELNLHVRVLQACVCCKPERVLFAYATVLQPENPMCVLTQELAKKFMFGSREAKYQVGCCTHVGGELRRLTWELHCEQFYEKATQLGDMSSAYRTASEETDTMGTHLNSAQIHRNAIAKKFRECEREYKSIGKVGSSVG